MTKTFVFPLNNAVSIFVTVFPASSLQVFRINNRYFWDPVSLVCGLPVRSKYTKIPTNQNSVSIKFQKLSKVSTVFTQINVKTY